MSYFSGAIWGKIRSNLGKNQEKFWAELETVEAIIEETLGKRRVRNHAFDHHNYDFTILFYYSLTWTGSRSLRVATMDNGRG